MQVLHTATAHAISVDVGTTHGGGFGRTVELDVSIPAIDAAGAETPVARAHEVSTDTNATRGNVDITRRVG